MALEKEKNKLILEKCQTILARLLKDDDNKYCVDCDAKSPRWASWNIGIFLCIRCAGIHRKLGVHISKVKSVNLDSWTPQQVVCIEQMGNSRARAVYEANLDENFRRPQYDLSALEQFIRSKYETKKYIAREWVPPPLPTPNWDADIEQILKKKKEKKVYSAKIELPATTKDIKHPKTSPAKAATKGDRNGLVKSPAETPAKDTAPSSNLVDLLGLDSPSPAPAASNGGASNGDQDVFGDFFSAPAPVPVPAANNNGGIGGGLLADASPAPTPDKPDDDEASFFNQKAPEAAPEKLSKDSILALYNQTPNPAPSPVQSPFANQNFGNPGTMFGLTGGQPGFAQADLNQMVNMNNSGQQAQFGPAGGSLSMFSQLAPGPRPSSLQFSPANPFAQMQGQMGNMSLGPVPAVFQTPHHPLTSQPNLWQ